MIGPDFSPPEAPVAPKWQESEGEYTRSDSRTADSRWWEQMKQRTDWGELLDINNQKPDMDVSKDKDLWRAPDCQTGANDEASVLAAFRI